MNAPVFHLEAQAVPRSRVRRGGWSWGPVEGARLRVLSLGAGVQSTTLALMAAHGEVGPMPDVALFADTGDESRRTMEHLSWLEGGNVLPFPVTRVHGPGRLSDAVLSKGGFSQVPFFTRRGIGRRQCTRHWKTDPIHAEVRRRLGIASGQRAPIGLVEMWIGFSTDEVVRAGASFDRAVVNRHPLLEARMSRADCLRWLVRHDYPVPPNSACIYCPLMDDAARRDQRDHDLESHVEACRIDAALRAPGRTPEWAHVSRRPLAEVDLSTAEDRGQGMLSVCDAGCGL